MGDKLEWRSLANVETAAEQLRIAAEAFAGVAKQMKEGDLEEALFYWNVKHFGFIDGARDLAVTCQGMIGSQISAKKDKRQSAYEATFSKSQKDEKRRELKDRAIKLLLPLKLADGSQLKSSKPFQLLSLLRLAAMQGLSPEISALINEMIEFGIEPDEETRTALADLEAKGAVEPEKPKRKPKGTK